MTDRAAVRVEEVLSRMPEGPIVGAEIGVDLGLMSHKFLRRPDLKLYMVDIWENAELRQKVAVSCTDFAADRRTIIHKDSVEASFDVPDESLDFVFIDADHNYWPVKADIAAWARKVKPGGWLCGHDYKKPSNLFVGLDPAVHEFIEDNGLTLTEGRDWTWFSRLS